MNNIYIHIDQPTLIVFGNNKYYYDKDSLYFQEPIPTMQTGETFHVVGDDRTIGYSRIIPFVRDLGNGETDEIYRLSYVNKNNVVITRFVQLIDGSIVTAQDAPLVTDPYNPPPIPEFPPHLLPDEELSNASSLHY